MENQEQLQNILQQLEQNSRRQARYAKLQCVFSFFTALSFAGLLLFVLSFQPQLEVLSGEVSSLAEQAQGLMTQAETVLVNMESVTQNIAQEDLAGMVRNVDELVAVSQDGIVQAVSRLETMDIETLNKAIADLSAVVETLADFLQMFQ